MSASILRCGIASAFTLLLTGGAGLRAQTPVGSAFTYQGRLTDGGAPATGVYDLEFKLFDASLSGAQIGSAQLKDDVSVAEGLFTVALDFGTAAFAGSARWLSIGVRPGSSTGSFTVLNARQELKPSPNSVVSQGVPWAGVSGKPAGFADDTDDDSGGDITGVTAGPGLTGGGATGEVALTVDFSGSTGAANAASRSDHNHLGQVWSGSSNPGFQLINSSTTGFAGLSSSTVSTTGRAVQGAAGAATGQTFAVWGRNFSTEGTGVFGEHFAVSGTEPGVLGQTHSTTGLAVGVLGVVVPTAPGGSSAAVRGINNGTGGSGIGVWGSQAGSGWGVNGTTASGVGVRGVATESSGIGVRAIGSGTDGTALEIASGAIRVAGAGLGTGTAAFVHIADAANSCDLDFDSNQTVIDNPFANGDPNAILIVTMTHPEWSSYNPTPIRVQYGNLCGVPDRWGIVWPQVNTMQRFNILVIKP